MKRLIFIPLAVLLLAACTRGTGPTVLPPAVNPTEPPAVIVTEPPEVVATEPPATQSPATQLYLQAAQVALEDFRTAIEAIDAQVDMYEVNQQWIYDAGWKDTTFKILDDLQAAADELHALPEASPELAELDRLLKLIADETPLYIEEFTNGINNVDVNSIDRARIHRKTMQEYWDAALVEINKFITITP